MRNTECTLAIIEFGGDDVIVERADSFGWQFHLCHCNCRKASALVQFEALTTSGLYSATWSNSWFNLELGGVAVGVKFGNGSRLEVPGANDLRDFDFVIFSHWL